MFLLLGIGIELVVVAAVSATAFMWQTLWRAMSSLDICHVSEACPSCLNINRAQIGSSSVIILSQKRASFCFICDGTKRHNPPASCTSTTPLMQDPRCE